MNLTEFAKLARKIHGYFGSNKKILNSQITIWHESTRKFSREDISAAFTWMEDNLERVPTNIPKAIKSAIFELNKGGSSGQDESFQNGKFGPCDGCNGTGIFQMKIFDVNGRWHELIQYCADCENWMNWTNSPGKRISSCELITKGIEFAPYNKVLIKGERVS